MLLNWLFALFILFEKPYFKWSVRYTQKICQINSNAFLVKFYKNIAIFSVLDKKTYIDKNTAYRFSLEYQILEYIRYLKKMYKSIMLKYFGTTNFAKIYNTIMKKYFGATSNFAEISASNSTQSFSSNITNAPSPNNIRVKKVESAHQCGYSRACRSPYAHSYPHNGYKWEKWTDQNCSFVQDRLLIGTDFIYSFLDKGPISKMCRGSSNHLIIWQFDHLTILSSDHPAIWSFSYLIIQLWLDSHMIRWPNDQIAR